MIMVRKTALAALAVASIALAMTAGTTAPALAAPATAEAASAVTSYGQLPVMGYNPWYQYGVHVTEAGLLHQANLLVSTGMAAAGYGGLYLDDGWMASARTTAGALTWDSTKFPHGIPALASQVHALGLKFGIYEAIGTRTCKNLPGSYGHYVQDAKTFASWGVDYAKIDSCGGLPAGTTEAGAAADFTAYGSALRGAAMVYSEELPIPYIGTSSFLPAVQTSAGIANLWRVTNDETPAVSASTTILGHLAADLHLHGFAGPGHWNDLDMLVSGVPVFRWTLAQQESQLSVWAEEASRSCCTRTYKR
jgi:alpha-galactosidase